MTESREIFPVPGPVSGTIRPPGSKSITNRALVIAALADGASTLTGVLESRDTQVMRDSLRRLGIPLDENLHQHRIVVQGQRGQIPNRQAELWLENSGTSIRFLTALTSLGEGTYRLDGNTRMRERPIRDLIESLREFGVDATCQLGTDCPPVVVRARGLRGGAVKCRTGLSSQFLSAMLMVAPAARGPVDLLLSGEVVSEPYIQMTIDVMEQFGVRVDRPATDRYHIEPQAYSARTYDIEPDASAASYFFAAAAITGGRVTVAGLTRRALQGDVRFVEALERMGCTVIAGADSLTVQGGPLRGIDIDMNDISDTAQTLAAVAPFAAGPTRIRRVAHMRHKETDRVLAVVTELRKLGLNVEEHPDGMTIHPGPLRPAAIDTYDDHRMAMSFALIGLRQPGVVIRDPGCTAKTYPEFFQDLDQLCTR